MSDLTNRAVIVTGAAGGLGRAVSRRFQAAGARLILVDRSDDRLSNLFPELVGSPDALLATGVDLTDPQAVNKMVSETVVSFGRIDVLINVAGGFRAGTPVHETPLETWSFLFDLNLHTALIVSKAVVPQMLEQGSGRIVNVAARAALKGGAKMAAYSASKTALVRLTESMAAELKRSGVNVNCVLPGTIDTPGNRQAMPKADTSRWVSPEALADVILFLASDAARAIHGAAVPVYGTG